MSYAIIGFGKMGQALAKVFARSGIPSVRRHHARPEKFAPAAAALGPEVMPKTLAEAVQANVIFLAVRYEAHADVAAGAAHLEGKDIVDVTNAYGIPSDKLGGQPSGRVVARAFAGARLVKGFNHLVASVFARDPHPHGGRRVVFLTSDDDGATAEVATLAERLGLFPVNLGGLAEGGLLVQAHDSTWGRSFSRI